MEKEKIQVIFCVDLLLKIYRKYHKTAWLTLKLVRSQAKNVLINSVDFVGLFKWRLNIETQILL